MLFDGAFSDAASEGTFTLTVSEAESPGSLIGGDNWSTRFTGNLYFDGGTYQMTITTDDEFSLYVNGVQ